MQPTAAEPLASLYTSDETAWLDEMARLVAERRLGDIDLDHLAQFLADVSNSQRREVENRLAALLAHLLKWAYQPDRRSRSWRATIVEQQQEFRGLAARGVLRNHADAVLPEVYRRAVERAAAETGIAPDYFPADCPYTVGQLLTTDFLAE